MNLAFIVLLGTAAPQGFAHQEDACAFVAEKGGQLFGQEVQQFGYGSRFSSCYAVENGCERARRDGERPGVKLVPMVCETRKEVTERVIIEAKPVPTGKP